MRKTLFTQLFICFLFICSAITTFAQNKLSDSGTAEVSGTSTYEPSNAPIVFLDQLPNQVNGLFADSNCLICGSGQQSIADDFVTAIGGPDVGITEIIMWGGYFPENIPNTTDNFTIILHDDAGGPNADLDVRTGLQPTRAITGAVLFGVDEYMFTFDFSGAPILIPSPGTYWIEIFNNSVESDNFFWETGNNDPIGGVVGSAWDAVAPGVPPWNLDPAQDLAIQINGDDGIPPAPTEPTLVSPSNGATEVAPSISLTWNASAGADSYGLQVSLNSDFSSTIYNKSNIGTNSDSLSNLAENTKYYWRVNASNSSGTSGYSSPFNFTTVSTVTLNKTINFPSKTNPSDYTSNEYKIVGLPGVSNLDVTSILSGTQGTDWEVYWDNGTVSDYYVKYDGSSTFQFSTGSAFWIINKGNLNISKTVGAASVSTSGSVGIQLGDGFNLITNPFTISVDWVDVQGANSGFGEGINTFTGGWSNSSKLEPYIGYLFDNPGIGTLQIPYPFSSTPLEKKTDPAIWRIKVELTCGELFDKTTSFGISGEATEGRDKLDFRKPRGMGNIPFVYFYHPDWDDGYGIFATDIRPEFEEEQNWDLKVYSELRESEKLKFSGIEEIPGEMEIYLVDKDRAKYLNLREESEYEFTPVKNVSEFQILVGKMEKISSKLNNLIPAEFALGNNFPNPFNPVTTIPLSAPQSAEIRLVIYNILGQEVKVLFNGTVEAGKHWYVWDGKDDKGFTVPSGIYVYNFISDAGINISKKMILMK